MSIAPQERQAVAELSLQPGRVAHLARRDLHGIEQIDADVDEIADQLVDVAAGVQIDLGLGVLADRGEHPGVVRLDQAAIHGRRHHRAGLRRDVVAGHDDSTYSPISRSAARRQSLDSFSIFVSSAVTNSGSAARSRRDLLDAAHFVGGRKDARAV